ncbi:MAG: hypothetical protein QXZ20_03535 [Candidatus Aenigmatarchaeota archaeon]
MKIIKIIFLITFILISLNCFTEEQQTKRKVQLKEVQGRVVWVSKNYIAVVYREGEGFEDEILLPLDRNLKFEYIKSLEDIAPTDIVRVRYEEVIEEAPQETKEFRKAKAISFIKKGPRIRPSAPDREETKVLDNSYRENE